MSYIVRINTMIKVKKNLKTTALENTVDNEGECISVVYPTRESRSFYTEYCKCSFSPQVLEC